MNRSSTITGVKVFRSGSPEPLQLLPACKKSDLQMQLTEYDRERDLLKHQDLNFDGYEDVELLQYFVPHLGKSLFCIYVWSAAENRFIQAPEIPDTDPVAHPETKTISVHEDSFGGVFTDSVYKCQAANRRRELINGKLKNAAWQPSGCDDVPDRQLVCPAARAKNKR